MWQVRGFQGMVKIMLNDKDPEFWQDPAWYRALERTERPATPEAGTGVPASANGEAVGFRSEAGLLAPLAAPDAGLRARAPVMPDWLATLKDAFAAPYNAEQMRKHLQNADVDHPLAGCLPAIGPLLQHGLTLIHERARALHQ